MSAPVLASLVSLIPNLLIAIHALLGWSKMRDTPRLLMLLVFGSSVVSSLLSLAVSLMFENSGAELFWISKLADALTLFAVFAFFVFMAEFTPVRPAVRTIALGALVLIFGGIVLSPYDYSMSAQGLEISRPQALLLAELVYFIVLVATIAFRFWQYSTILVGLSRKRVEAIALGTTLSLLGIIISLASAPLGDTWAEVGNWLSRAIGLLAGVIYYVGFATPRWLRDIWTSGQRRRIAELSLATAGGRPPAELIGEALRTAIEVSGAQSGALVLWNEEHGQLEVAANSGLPEPLLDSLKERTEKFRAKTRLQRNDPIVSEVQRFNTQTGDISVMDTPLFMGDNFMGVIRLVADRSLVFEPEDAAIMQVLGAQAAVTISTGLRLDEVQQEAKLAGQLYSEAGHNLRQRMDELRAVLGSMIDGLYAVDKNGQVILVNRAGAEMAGTTDRNALGRPAAEIFRFAVEHNDMLEVALSQGETTVHQETTLRTSNSEIPVSVGVAPLLDDDGQPRGAVISFRDISAEKELQRTKDEFIATVSHELRTPLTAILGYADLMLRGTPDQPSARQKTQLTAIRNNGSRLLTLINDLLDLSKIEAGQVNLTIKPVALANVISRSLTSLQVLATNKKIELSTKLPISLPLVLADFDRLSQIIDNLLSNAIKFTPNGGHISVEARAVRSGDNVPTMVEVSVTDSGIGIEVEHMARIWDRFYQVESSATRRFGGTGLGLPIVKHLVEMHGGELQVSSQGKDNGATFTFSLPIAGPEQQTEPRVRLPEDTVPAEVLSPPSKHELDSTKPLVLVADDDPYFVHILHTHLEHEGYRVAQASDGVEVLKMARELQPFAITLDVQLPRLDGWSVLNQLKRDPETQNIPVVIMSVVDNRDFGLTLGATDYLVKPVNHARLLDTLARLTNNEGGAQVLVVEDDNDVREMLHQALEQGPWTTVLARDGAEAMSTLENSKPGVVILDLMMPNMDGFEVLSRMRSNPETAKIPVIILTAKALTEDEITFLNRTAQRLILKQGHTIDQLIEEVRRTLAAWREATVQSS